MIRVEINFHVKLFYIRLLFYIFALHLLRCKKDLTEPIYSANWERNFMPDYNPSRKHGNKGGCTIEGTTECKEHGPPVALLATSQKGINAYLFVQNNDLLALETIICF